MMREFTTICDSRTNKEKVHFCTYDLICYTVSESWDTSKALLVDLVEFAGSFSIHLIQGEGVAKFVKGVPCSSTFVNSAMECSLEKKSAMLGLFRYFSLTVKYH